MLSGCNTYIRPNIFVCVLVLVFQFVFFWLRVLDHSVSFLVDVKLSYPILSYLKHKSRLQVLCEYQIDACMMVFIEIYYSLCYATVTTKALFTFATSIKPYCNCGTELACSFLQRVAFAFFHVKCQRDVDISSVRPSVCLSVRHTLVLCQSGERCRRVSFIARYISEKAR